MATTTPQPHDLNDAIFALCVARQMARDGHNTTAEQEAAIKLLLKKESRHDTRTREGNKRYA